MRTFLGVPLAMEHRAVIPFDLYVWGDVTVCIAEAESITISSELVTDDKEWKGHVAQFKRGNTLSA